MFRKTARIILYAALTVFCSAALLHLFVQQRYNDAYARISHIVNCINAQPNVDNVKAFQEFLRDELPNDSFAKTLYGISSFEEEGSSCHLAQESLKSFCSLRNAPERMALSSAVANCHLVSAGRPTHQWDPETRLKYANESFMAVVFHFLPLLDNICDGAGHGHLLQKSSMDRKSIERLFNALERLLNYTESVRQEQTGCNYQEKELEGMERACYTTTMMLSEHSQECQNQLEDSRDSNHKCKGAMRALQEDHETCVRDAERLSFQHKHCERRKENMKKEYEECKGIMQRVVLGENKTREELVDDVNELKEMISVLITGTDRCFSQLNETKNALLELKEQERENRGNTGHIASSVHTLSESVKSVARDIKSLQNAADSTERKESEGNSVLSSLLNGYHAFSRSRRETKKNASGNLVSRFGSLQGLHDLITSPLILCMYLEALIESEHIRPEARDTMIVVWMLCQILFLTWMLMLIKWISQVVAFISHALKRIQFVMFNEKNKISASLLAKKALQEAKRDILSTFREPLQSLQFSSQETAYLYDLVKQEIEFIKSQSPGQKDIDNLIAGVLFLETKISGVSDEVEELVRRIENESLPPGHTAEQDKPLPTELYKRRKGRTSTGERPSSASKARAVSRLAHRNASRAFAMQKSESTAISEIKQRGGPASETETNYGDVPVTPLRRSQRVMRQREMLDSAQDDNSKPKSRGHGTTPKRKAR